MGIKDSFSRVKQPRSEALPLTASSTEGMLIGSAPPLLPYAFISCFLRNLNHNFASQNRFSFYFFLSAASLPANDPYKCIFALTVRVLLRSQCRRTSFTQLLTLGPSIIRTSTSKPHLRYDNQLANCSREPNYSFLLLFFLRARYSGRSRTASFRRSARTSQRSADSALGLSECRSSYSDTDCRYALSSCTSNNSDKTNITRGRYDAFQEGNLDRL